MKTLFKILFVAVIVYLPMTLSAQVNENAPLYAETIYGAVSIATENPWNTHFRTDEGKRFYFNAPVWFKDGEIGSHSNNLYLQTHGSTKMTILRSNGNVGIGTNNPQARLDVNGNVRIGDVTTPVGYKLYVEEGILAERVRIAAKNGAEWADYVFEPDYDLNSIEQVEKFIKANKHLPNVPSAKEVGEKGVDVVEMDATLLRQIEELWLHVIELKKENETLKEKVEVLESTKR